MSIETENHEMRSLRTVGRDISSIVSELQQGAVEKVVVMKHGKMVGVIITVDAYEELKGAKT